MVCSVAINSLEITLILQQARSEVNIGPDRTHRNMLTTESYFFEILMISSPLQNSITKYEKHTKYIYFPLCESFYGELE